MENLLNMIYLLWGILILIVHMPLTLTCGIMILFPDNKKMLLYLSSAVIYLFTCTMAVSYPSAYGITFVLFLAWCLMVIASLGVFKVLCKIGLLRYAYFTIPLALSLFSVTLKMLKYQFLVANGRLEDIHIIPHGTHFNAIFMFGVFVSMLIVFLIAVIGYQNNNLRFHVLLFLALIPVGFISTYYIAECFSGVWNFIVFTIVGFLFFSIIPFMRYIENRTRQDEPKVMRAKKIGFIPGVFFFDWISGYDWLLIAITSCDALKISKESSCELKWTIFLYARNSPSNSQNVVIVPSV